MEEKIFKGDTFVERRRHPRLPLKLVAHYQILHKSKPEETGKSKSLNIGVGGMALRIDQRIEVNTQIVLDLYIPPEDKREKLGFMTVCPEEECRKITIHSRVAWCSPFTDNKYIFGVEFLNMAAGDIEYLKTFLEDYKIPEAKNRLSE